MSGPAGPSRLTGDAGPRRSAARAAMVAALLAVAVTGLRAGGAFSHQASSALVRGGAGVIGGAFAVAEGAALVCGAVVLALLLPRPRRPRPVDEAEEPPRPPLPWWAKFLLVLSALALAAAPLVILLSVKNPKRSAPPARARPPAPRPGTGHLAPLAGGSAWLLLAGVLLAAAAALTAAAVIRRRLRRDRAGASGRPAHAVPLAEGLAAARDALLAAREPREAIIACYAAMERGFAAAGSAPAAADTPAEVLTRAGRAGLVRSGSAEVLTALFRRARYSTQPMTGADADAAGSALARMRADLEDAGAGGGR